MDSYTVHWQLVQK